jgi:hypothetical protein
MTGPLDRRRFLARTATGAAALAAGIPAGCDDRADRADSAAALDVEDGPPPTQPYTGPRVVLIRFGGGVRRRETIAAPEQTYCPFVYHELASKQGTLFRNVMIEDGPGIVTSHGQGTLYLLTGKYWHYEDISHKPFSERFEPVVPTLFEYLRKEYAVPEHQALIINGEDRINEEFYTFSNHHLYGVRYRSTVLSLYRFKTYLLRQELAGDTLSEKERAEKAKKLAEMEARDYRVADGKVVSPELDGFWERWKGYYGRTGLVNPRGDRLLTALALRALQELRPKLLLINYQDPDYVHWGPAHFYTRAISIIDEGVRELWSAVQADEEYRDNTVFVVVPDCGRDSNRALAVPYQHHFNTRSAREIFAIVAGPKGVVPHGSRAVDRPVQQTSVTATVGRLMGFPTPHAEAPSLLEKA